MCSCWPHSDGWIIYKSTLTTAIEPVEEDEQSRKQIERETKWENENIANIAQIVSEVGSELPVKEKG